MPYSMIRHLRRTVLLSHQIRTESTMTNLTHEDYLIRPPITQWSKIIREAEKIVGYPTSFMNLRWLLSDEFANMAMHLRKVVNSNHPLMKTAKSVLYNEHNNLQPWGLVILLLSKAVNPPMSPLQANKVNESQRNLAELTEMIRTGHSVHRGLLNIPRGKYKDFDTELFTNKIAILIGDYLLVTANGMLARLKNQDLSYLISTALRDISEGEFFGDRDVQNLPLPGKPLSMLDIYEINSNTMPFDVKNVLGSPTKEWTLRTLYGGGSLFGRGCEGAVLLAGRNKKDQERAYLLGSHLCLVWQAASDLQKFNTDNKDSFSLVSAPVLFAVNESPDIYKEIEKYKNDLRELDYDALKGCVLKTNAIEQTRTLLSTNSKIAARYADMFGNCESISTIKRLMETLL
ncbi:PREDICTED: decaprenyl-diphosphate synthase subunit 2-like [Papilio polytes]|uniref:decaprenyl-diphosphate synthase subunit 2-like n=1 Tax=Papilio polytes TaxID=76194 RepID=UPI0006763104|nr:PREDICTED: decaprenyl-diphosphate synthase subunit 2-like [Papilio polytes]